MLTTACLTLLTVVVSAAALGGYWVGRTRRPRSESYLAARASGWRDRGLHEEATRAALRRQLDEVTADRDRTDAALNEMGEMYDRLLAQRFVPLARRAVTAYDHEEAGL